MEALPEIQEKEIRESFYLKRKIGMKTIIRNAALQKTAFFVSLPGYKNKKRVTAVTQYLVNLKSNTMKNTHANVERICEFHKLFLKKMLFLKIL